MYVYNIKHEITTVTEREISLTNRFNPIVYKIDSLSV